jgi:hypothetical protein
MVFRPAAVLIGRTAHEDEPTGISVPYVRDRDPRVLGRPRFLERPREKRGTIRDRETHSGGKQLHAESLPLSDRHACSCRIRRTASYTIQRANRLGYFAIASSVEDACSIAPARTDICACARDKSFASMASLTPGITTAAYPVYSPGA